MVKGQSDRQRGNLYTGYIFGLAAMVLIKAPFHRKDSTYHNHCYTNHGAMAGTRNSSMGPP